MALHSTLDAFNPLLTAALHHPLVAAPLLLLSLFLLRAVYNVTVHPLARYPGPLSCAISTLPSLMHRADGTNHLWPQALHRKYGPIVRIGPSELSYIHPDTWRDIYAKGADFPKDFVGLGPDLAGPAETGIVRAPTPAAHARQRRLLGSAFAERAVRAQEATVQAHMAQLVDELAAGAAAGVPVDLAARLAFAAFDNMAELTFGEPGGLGMQKAGRFVPWVRDTYATIKMVSLGMALRGWRPPLGRWLLDTVWGVSRRKREEHNGFTMDRVRARLARGFHEADVDIWAVVARAGAKTGDPITPAEMYSNAATYMIGGTETTTAATAALSCLLCRHPAKQARVQRELDRAVRAPADLCFQRLQGLTYLNACIEEAMRFYPPAPTPMPRVVPPGGRLVCGRWVPGGTRVDVPLYAMFRSEEHFADPDAFVPERWLPDECPGRYADDRRDVAKAFSIGPRDCIGKTLAYHDMRMILASVFWHFDVSLAEPEKDWFEQQSYGIWDKPPLWVNLTPRKGKGSDGGE
ncbi:hypothetical protein P8C59_002992 [Phyllachora maydis]|uniref:Cytochrome P450 n=1 Tax=Phyllachora maydis TaxID=1825666 RepID=A0AAD9HZJ4_9PEZI|nr:hypothetical protein P8C59_002992 [Phyllachora maydis]